MTSNSLIHFFPPANQYCLVCPAPSEFYFHIAGAIKQSCKIYAILRKKKKKPSNAPLPVPCITFSVHRIVVQMSLCLLHAARISKDALKKRNIINTTWNQKRACHSMAATCRVNVFKPWFFIHMKDSPRAALFSLAAVLSQACASCQHSPMIQRCSSFGSNAFVKWFCTTNIYVGQRALRRGLPRFISCHVKRGFENNGIID